MESQCAKEIEMLKGIPSLLSPDLMHALLSMGHGDEIVLADGNFPGPSHTTRLIRADGLGVCAMLETIVRFFPLDEFVEDHAVVMAVVDPKAPEPPIWEEFRQLLAHGEGRAITLTAVERQSFYERARRAYCIVATSERALYANLLLKKGVVLET
jgi:L-fucose mutarotase